MVNMKFEKLYDFRTTLYSGVFGIADYEFQIWFSGFRRLWVYCDDIFCFPFHLIFSHVVLSNRYCKFFCYNFILAIFRSIVYYESIRNSLITSFFRSASEPELSEPESFIFGTVTLSSKLFSDASTLYSTYVSTKWTEKAFCTSPRGKVQNAFSVPAIWWWEWQLLTESPRNLVLHTYSNQAPRRRQNFTTSMSLYLGFPERRMSESWTETLETSKHKIFMKLDRFRNFMSAILDPLYGILKIQFGIRNR